MQRLLEKNKYYFLPAMKITMAVISTDING